MRVCVVPEFPLNLMTGGLQVQACELATSLQQIHGVNPFLFNWSDRTKPADIYHFVSIQASMFPIAELLIARNIPYVLTTLGAGIGNTQITIAAIRRKFASCFLKMPILRQKVYSNAKKIIVLMESDREAVSRIYGLPRESFEIVPNGMASDFFSTSPQLWQKTFGKKDFLLCVGAIQPRKNQLQTVKIANALNLPLVVLGPILNEADHSYNVDFKHQMKQNEKFGGVWLQHLENNDPLLHSAYAACKACILLSVQETQPLSILQAMAANKPVLLGSAPYTSSQPFNSLPTVNPNNFEEACAATKQLWQNGIPTSLSPDFTWPNIAKRIANIYDKILEGRSLATI